MGWDPYCAARSIHTGTGRKDLPYPTLPSPPRDRARAEGGGEAHLSRPRNQTWVSVSHSLHAGLHTHTSAHSEKNLLHEEAMQCNAMQCNGLCREVQRCCPSIANCFRLQWVCNDCFECRLSSFEGKVRDPNPSQVPSGSSDSSHHTNLSVRSDYNGWAWRLGWDGETLHLRCAVLSIPIPARPRGPAP